MSDSVEKIVRITDEASFWDALDAALAYDGDEAPFQVDFSQCAWAKVRLKYDGPRFRASLTPSTMRGLLIFRQAYIALPPLFYAMTPTCVG